jgi:hypothetical protein
MFWNIEICGSLTKPTEQEGVIFGSSTGIEADTAADALLIALAKMERGQEGWWKLCEPLAAVYKIERFDTLEASIAYPKKLERYQLVCKSTGKPVA